MVIFNEGISGPQPLSQFFPGYHLSGVFKQQDQNLKGLILQLNPET
jgi:hypothetical protein